MSSNSSTTSKSTAFPDLSPSSPPPDFHPLSDQPTSIIPTHPTSLPTPTTFRGQLDHNKLVNQKKRIAFEKLQEESTMACDVEIRAFAECARGRTFSTVWACREHNKEMHTCMSN